MLTKERNFMSEDVPVVLLSETHDPAIQEVRNDPMLAEMEQQLGVNIRFGKEGQPMKLEEAAHELNRGAVDIFIAGAATGSPEVIQTAIHHVNRKSDNPSDHKKFVHSFFIMEKDGREPIFFADCAVNEKPRPSEIVHIAEETAESVKQLGYEPVLAFLSLSTFGSASGDKLMGVQQTREAVQKFKEKNPGIIAYGEIQADAALNPAKFAKKAESAGIKIIDGKMPNVFIFPDGASGNITYKMVEELAGYVAIGPMLNGIAKNMHDLSRGVGKEGLLRSIHYSVLLYRARKEARIPILQAA